jgi:hypothetical protein
MDEDTERRIPTLEEMAGMSDEALWEHSPQELLDMVRKEITATLETKRAMEASAAQIVSNLEAYKQARKDQDQIALFLRDNYADEIKLGKHKGMTFADVIVMYLSRERQLFHRGPTGGGHA